MVKTMRVGIISTYPPPGSKHAKIGGVASYTKNLVSSLLNNCDVTIFANRLSHTDNRYYNEHMMIYRCWSKQILYPFQIFKSILNNNIDIAHVQHEIYLYGGLDSAIVFPLLLLFIRLLRKPVVVTLHGVIPLSKVDEHFLKVNWIKGNATIMKFGLILLIKAITHLSTSIIVHEEKFKEVLKNEYNCSGHKVFVIHHGIEERYDLINNDEAKEKLNLIGKDVILFFGYITGYKNVELLISSINYLKNRDYLIVIAGGPHPRLSAYPKYRRYLSKLREKALTVSKDRILFRGYIAEEEIPLYFSAADLVVFPYRIAMSISGPMCIAISYKRPFIISNSFKHIINIKELLFKEDPQELANKIQFFLKNKIITKKATIYIEQLYTERLWGNVVKETIHLYEDIIQ